MTRVLEQLKLGLRYELPIPKGKIIASRKRAKSILRKLGHQLSTTTQKCLHHYLSPHAEYLCLNANKYPNKPEMQLSSAALKDPTPSPNS